MPQAFTCPNSHQWEDTFADGLSLAVGGAVLCPECGARVEILAEAQATRTTGVPHQRIAQAEAGGTPEPPLPTVATATTEELLDPTAAPLAAVPGYLILKELGRGGMGVVYQAKQVGLKRTVALKMILGGAHAGSTALARFRAEAEAVALLQHPNIIQIYEIGEHEGRPYYSMEFVEGGNLFELIYDHPLPAKEAARLIATLARAMHAAHDRGIVHRDLKPANILLTKDGTPKITDFGLAKNLGEGAGQTRTGDVMGTPSYMAPEQAEGRLQDIGPHTDVYALGAILYELLTARPPFKAETALDTLLQVLYQEPLPPNRLLPTISRDLETICLKCLNKEIDKRYGSALELAEDLERYLDGQPIVARPISWWERAGKWARRRPAAAALIAVSVLSLLTMLVGSVGFLIYFEQLAAAREEARLEAVGQAREAAIQRDRAQEEERKAIRSRNDAEKARDLADRQRQRAEWNFRQAKQAVKDLLFEVGRTELVNARLMDDTRQRLLSRAAQYYKDFLERQSQEAELRQETGQAFQEVGNIYRLLGRFQEAEQAQREAIKRFEELAAAFPAEPAHRRDLAFSHFLLGQLYRRLGQLAEAEKAYRHAIQMQQTLVQQQPQQLDYRHDLARTLNDLALVLKITNQPEASEKTYRQALRWQEELVQKTDNPKPDYREQYAGSLNDLGHLLRSVQRFGEAEKSYREALAHLEQLVAQQAAASYRHKLAATCNNLGNVLLETQGPVQAEPFLRRALTIRQQLAADFPSMLGYRQEVAESHANLAAVLAAGKRFEEAEKESSQAVDLQRKLTAAYPFVPDFQSNLGLMLDNLAALALSQNRPENARALLQEAAQPHETARAADPENPLFRQHRRKHYLTLADTLLRLGEKGDPSLHAEASRAALEFSRFNAKDPDDQYRAAVLLARCVPLAGKDSRLADKERKQRSESYAVQAVQLLQQAVAGGYANLEQLRNVSALGVLRSREDFQKLVRALENKVPKE